MKPRAIFPLLTALAVFITMTACVTVSIPKIVRGSGTLATETRTVSGFDQVSVGGGMRLELAQGAEESLEIEADDNLLAHIESNVTGDKLTVGFKNGISVNTTRPVTIRLTMIDIRGIEISGGGSLSVDQIDSDELALHLSGGSHAEIGNLTVFTLNADLSGGSNAEIVGQAPELNLEMSGGGVFKAEDLETTTVNANLSGGAVANLWVTDALTANLTGGSQLYYFGEPSISQTTSGGSALTSEGEHE